MVVPPPIEEKSFQGHTPTNPLVVAGEHKTEFSTSFNLMARPHDEPKSQLTPAIVAGEADGS